VRHAQAPKSAAFNAKPALRATIQTVKIFAENFFASNAFS
jgi:hypothetical protein